MRKTEQTRSAESAPLLRLLLASLLLFSPLSAVAARQSPDKLQAARSQFQSAEKQRTALQGKPQKERTVAEYQKLVNAYRRVYVITPHAVEVPAALLAVAELYQEMGRQFDPKFHQSAIDAYQFLLHEYPTNRFREDALLTIAQIQQEDLNQLDAAELTFQEFLRRYPRSQRADQVRESVAAIATAREKERQAASRKALADERERQRRIPQVTSIRHWNAENYTRIVIDVEDEVKHQAARISNPDRIYFDLHRARLSSPLVGKSFEVQGGFLKTIRVAQNQAGVVRVVLEVEKVKNFSAFLLPNPYRLVIDIYGEPVSVAKNAPAPEAQPPAKTESQPAKAETEPAPVRAELPRAEAPPAEKPSAAKTTQPPKEVSKTVTPPVSPQPARNGRNTLTRALGLKAGRIVIDAGHGGHDTGTVGPTGLMEKDLCLDLAHRLGKLIEERVPGTEVVYTREDDTFVPLEERTALANQSKADLFVSIHANSSRDRSARGVETYYLNFSASDDALEVAARENALSQSSISELQDMIKKIARNEKIEESRELATEIQDSLAKRLKRVSSRVKNRGVKKAPFVVLIGANMPSVLSEISFLSNPTDEQLLKKSDHRNRVAEAIFQGVQSYLHSIGTLTYNSPKPMEAGR